MIQTTLSLFDTPPVLSEDLASKTKRRQQLRRNFDKNRDSLFQNSPYSLPQSGDEQFRRDTILRSVIKKECAPFTFPGIDSSLLKRLSVAIKTMRDADKSHEMGAKTVIGRQINALDGFELNQKYSMGTVLSKMPMTLSRYGMNKIHIEVRPGDRWMHPTHDGYIVHINEFVVDQNYQVIQSRKFTSEPVPKNERPFQLAYERETKTGTNHATIIMVGVQSFYKDRLGLMTLNNSNGMRARLFVHY